MVKKIFDISTDPPYKRTVESVVYDRLRHIDSNKEKDRIFAFVIAKLWESSILTDDDLMREILHDEDKYTHEDYEIRDIDGD